PAACRPPEGMGAAIKYKARPDGMKGEGLRAGWVMGWSGWGLALRPGGRALFAHAPPAVGQLPARRETSGAAGDSPQDPLAVLIRNGCGHFEAPLAPFRTAAMLSPNFPLVDQARPSLGEGLQRGHTSPHGPFKRTGGQ